VKGALSLFLGFISMTQPVHVRNSFQLLVRRLWPALRLSSARMGSGVGRGRTGIPSFCTLSPARMCRVPCSRSNTAPTKACG
jgi:hypothetical protein